MSGGRATLEERLWPKVDPSGPCWEWTGALTGTGYGNIYVEPGLWSPAHRVVWEALVGPLPAESDLDHLCRNKRCVNPDHLEPVSHRENVLRGVSPPAQQSRWTTCPQGHPLSGDNLYVRPSGKRECRECMRIRDRARNVRDRVKRNAATRLRHQRRRARGRAS